MFFAYLFVSQILCSLLNKSNASLFTCIYLIHDLKVESEGGIWVQSTNFPLTCATSSHFLQATVKMNVSIFSVKTTKQLRQPISFKTDGLLTFSDTQGPLAFRETHGPIAPEILISLEVWNNRKPHNNELINQSTCFFKYLVKRKASHLNLQSPC